MYPLDVPDMTCGHCASAVERAVNSVDSNAKVAVDIGTKTVSIDSALAPEVHSGDRMPAIRPLKKSCCSHVA